MENNLIPVESVNALELFSSEKSLLSLLDAIEQAATDFNPDTSTDEGRKEIASRAYAVSRSKVVIDNAGKALTEDWMKKKRAVDDGRRQAREFCDDLRDRIREPLNEWEAEEAKKAEEAAIKAEIEADEITAHEMNDLFDREAKVAAWEAEQARIAQEKADQEQREREEKERAEREARIAKEAAEKAERVAKDKIAEEIRLRKEAEERAEREAQQAAERAAREKAEAIENARREFQEKAEQERLERERVEAEKAEQERQQRLAEERKKAQKRHIDKVNREVLAGLRTVVDAETAKTVLSAIIGGSVPNVRVEY